MTIAFSLPPNHPSGFRFTAADIEAHYESWRATSIEQIEFVTLAEVGQRIRFNRERYPDGGTTIPSAS